MWSVELTGVVVTYQAVDSWQLTELWLWVYARGDFSLILWTVRAVLMSGLRLVGGLVLIALQLHPGSPLPGHGGQLEEELELGGGSLIISLEGRWYDSPWIFQMGRLPAQSLRRLSLLR